MRKIKSILLVDDNDADNFLHQLFIEETGFCDSTKICINGKQALQFIQDCIDRPDHEFLDLPELIFLDINMPIMTGWEFIQAFEQVDFKHFKRPIVVMVSTSTNPDDKARATQFKDIACFVSKPLSHEKLAELADKYF
jgi:CheY-like chemotaxis protein